MWVLGFEKARKAYSSLEYLSGARYGFDETQNLQGRYVIQIKGKFLLHKDDFGLSSDIRPEIVHGPFLPPVSNSTRAALPVN